MQVKSPITAASTARSGELVQQPQMVDCKLHSAAGSSYLSSDNDMTMSSEANKQS